MKNVVFAPVFIAVLNLLALLLFYTETKSYQGQPVSIRHFLPSEDRSNVFNAWSALSTLKNKKQVLFILQGNEQDKQKLNMVEQNVSLMHNSCDSVNFVRVHLRNSINYSTLISLLNIMLRTEHKRYMLWKNDFYIIPHITSDCNEEEPVPIEPIYL
jgi:hypothetical protein